MPGKERAWISALQLSPVVRKAQPHPFGVDGNRPPRTYVLERLAAVSLDAELKGQPVGLLGEVISPELANLTRPGTAAGRNEGHPVGRRTSRLGGHRITERQLAAHEKRVIKDVHDFLGRPRFPPFAVLASMHHRVFPEGLSVSPERCMSA